MALSFVGFSNVGEFYSHHYIDAVLEGDLSAVLKRWAAAEKDGGPRAPGRQISALANTYFAAAAQAQRQDEPEERLELARGLHAALLEKLGYPRAPGAQAVEREGKTLLVPVVYTEARESKPFLWVLEAPFGRTAETDPFAEAPLAGQLPAAYAAEAPAAASWQELLDEAIFRGASPPRWVLFLAGCDVFLIDRHKWSQGKYLRFSLDELFGRRQPAAFDVFAALLHREVLCSEAGLLDRLDENSHKHAFAVSSDLKKGARKAIELLANEAIRYRRQTSKKVIFNDDTLAAELTRECLTYLYRLLFLFYVEARGGELDVAPMKSDAYREGYSLESLRDLELVPLTTPRALDGFYLHLSLERLFLLVNRGFGRDEQALAFEGADGFVIDGLRSPLFDTERTPLLSGVKLRNCVLQEVLQLLSLSEEKGKRERGRISYAQLGINQLGAVYEGLLSYSGFLAGDDLYEVQAAGASSEEEQSEARTYFVPKDQLGQYKKDEVVRDALGQPVVHPKGSFVYRLAGRDREKSASYYTPEVLTRCLTKYTLKERLEGLSADQVLALTVCEPAMGSGAFLNEAIGQLADAYLERKQAETGQTIATADYQKERQKVKHHLAVHNIYGVDLNPLAPELGKVSLWLSTLHVGARAPYLGQRIAVGNSLIGARREVFTDDRLAAKSGWHDLAPTRVRWGEARPATAVWHFLVPDPGMAPFDKDKLIAKLEPAACKQLAAWRKAMSAPFHAMDLQALARLGTRLDELFTHHLAERRRVLALTAPSSSLWGQPPSPDRRSPPIEECEEQALALTHGAAPGRRLGFVMDYWCALWFWPITEAGLLPTRDEWLMDIEGLLDSSNDVDALAQRLPRLALVQKLAARHRFFHWELSFCEAFADGGGFDVLLGNPPWIKLEWKEAGVLSDFDPLFDLRALSASDAAKRRDAKGLLQDEACRQAYLEEFEQLNGAASFLNATQNYPLLVGVQTNLYKCFQTLAWRVASATGCAGLIYQPGILDDPKGGHLRAEFAHRARLVGCFRNELLLFNGITNHVVYGLFISGPPAAEVRYNLACNLLHPRTLDDSLAHDGLGIVPGIKDEEGEWDLRGHKARVLFVDEQALALFARLFDEPGTPAIEARIPVLHSVDMLHVLRKLAVAPKLGPPGKRWGTTREWHEGDRTADGTIKQDSTRAASPDELIYLGPMLWLGNPYSKEPNEGCKNNKDYSSLDLESLPEDFLPRSKYRRGIPLDVYKAALPRWNDTPLSSSFRHIHRRMLAPTGERSLICALLPPGAMSVDGVFTMAFSSEEELLKFNAFCSSLVLDFFIRTTGKSDARVDLTSSMPTVEMPRSASARVLRLNCLTRWYAPLWERNHDPAMAQDAFAKPDPRLRPWSHLAATWDRSSALRTAYERRQALVELDALAALAFGLSADELCLIYNVQFPVLQQYERETFYDRRGRIVFTVNKGLSGVGLDRKQWTEVKDAKGGDRLPDFASAYEPPFDRCDREEDMRQAYEHFARTEASGRQRAVGECS